MVEHNAAGSLSYLIRQADHFHLAELCEPVLFDSRFALWTGCGHADGHHYGKGGLVVHTAEVVDLCLTINARYADCDKADDRKLFAAALFHDVGKLRDYEQVSKSSCTEWRPAKHKYHIHHIYESARVWSQAYRQWEADGFKGSDTYEDEVTHAILAHHGHKEWGSPVLPQTKIAHILHHCDCISARMYDMNHPS